MTPTSTQDRVYQAIKRHCRTVDSVAKYTKLPTAEVKNAVRNLRANHHVAGSINGRNELRVTTGGCLLERCWRVATHGEIA